MAGGSPTWKPRADLVVPLKKKRKENTIEVKFYLHLKSFNLRYPLNWR